MGKKKKVEEEVIIDAVDLPVDIAIDIPTSSVQYSSLAFGTAFTNYKNYIEPSDFEKTKKNMIPSIGSIVKDLSGVNYKIVDITAADTERKVFGANDSNTITVYTFHLEQI